MNDTDDWSALQDAWGAGQPATLFDVGPMIARARRQRRLTIWTIGGEWAMAAVGMGFMVEAWPRARTDGIMLAWWAFFFVLMCVIMVGFTWTRVAALREPAGTSLRDWLLLRRRRALLGLRLARLTHWTSFAMLPAPFVTMYTPRGTWPAAWSTVAVLLLLAGGWWWAWYKRRAMNAEIVEVEALACEWLDEPLGPPGPPRPPRKPTA